MLLLVTKQPLKRTPATVRPEHGDSKSSLQKSMHCSLQHGDTASVSWVEHEAKGLQSCELLCSRLSAALS